MYPEHCARHKEYDDDDDDAHSFSSLELPFTIFIHVMKESRIELENNVDVPYLGKVTGEGHWTWR